MIIIIYFFLPQDSSFCKDSSSADTTTCPNGSDEIDAMLHKITLESLLDVKTSWSWKRLIRMFHTQCECSIRDRTGSVGNLISQNFMYPSSPQVDKKYWRFTLKSKSLKQKWMILKRLILILLNFLHYFYLIICECADKMDHAALPGLLTSHPRTLFSFNVANWLAPLWGFHLPFVNRGWPFPAKVPNVITWIKVNILLIS